mmetsp:Transcript_9263/g.20725  ORF Transcript_9263/g.20725 Transcript_9263/m.20725 type:complete len:1085 (+) Transcript_9263:86-3340(+)
MDGLKQLLLEAGCPEGGVQDILSELERHGVHSIQGLREKLEEGEELGDLGISGRWKKKVRQLTMAAASSKVVHSKKEVELALDMSQLPKEQQQTDKWKHFESKYRPLFLDKLECTTTHQKYAVAVVSSASSSPGAVIARVLCVAFADTHRPEDWLCNLNVQVRSDHAVGGGAHAGFLNRVLHLQWRGLKRLCAQYQCSKVIFSGFSLGGAVAQLSGLMALRDPEGYFGSVEVLTVSFGSPMCSTEKLVEFAEGMDWSQNFLTIVWGEDPVPRLLNLVDSVDHVLSEAADLISDAASFFKPIVEYFCALSTPAASPGDIANKFRLARELVSAGNQRRSRSNPMQSDLHCASPREKRQRRSPDWFCQLVKQCDVYVPLGTYAFLSPSNSEVSIDFVTGFGAKERLGAASLLRSQLSPLEGLVDHNALMDHSLLTYKNIIGFPEFAKGLGRNRSIEYTSSSDSPGYLEFEVTIGKYRKEEWDANVRIHVILQGKGLDLVGHSGVTLHRTQGAKVVIGCARDTYCNLTIDVTAKQMPSTDLLLEVRPDCQGHRLHVVTLGLESADGDPSDYAEFDGHFFTRVMKAAWLHKHPELSKLLERLDELHPQSTLICETTGQWTVTDRTFAQLMNVVTDQRQLHTVGTDAESKDHIEKVRQWLLPKGGHILHTVPQKAGTVALCVAGVTYGVYVIATGGVGAIPSFSVIGQLLFASPASSLSVLLFGSPAVAAWFGGLGSAAVSMLTAGVAYNTMFCLTRVAYNELLLDLHAWTGDMQGSTTSKQFLAEKALIKAVRDRQARSEPPFPGPYHGSATPETQMKLGKIYEVVSIIHRMKEELARLEHICISGPQDAGKTLLSSQLLMDPELANRESSLRYHTPDTPCHKLTHSVLLMDTPGTTSIQRQVREVLTKGAGLLVTVHIHLIPFSGDGQHGDVETIAYFLVHATSSAPPVLVCLNQVRSRLLDGSGSYRSVDEMQGLLHGFQTRVRDGVRSLCRDGGMASWRGDDFNGWFHKKWSKVKIVFCELGPLQLSDLDMPAAMRVWLRDSDEVFNASKVGKWLQQTIDPKGENDELAAAVGKINFEEYARLSRS